MVSESAIVAFTKIDDPEDIEAYVAALSASDVVTYLYLVTEGRRRLYEAEKMLKSRVVAEQILSGGEQWTAPDGRGFVWTGDRARVCDDPALLKAELEELPLGVLGKLALRNAFKDQPLKVYLTEIDRIEQVGGPEAGRVIRAHISWKEGGPKLRPLDER